MRAGCWNGGTLPGSVTRSFEPASYGRRVKQGSRSPARCAGLTSEPPTEAGARGTSRYTIGFLCMQAAGQQRLSET